MRRRRFLQAGAIAGFAALSGVSVAGCSDKQSASGPTDAGWRALSKNLRGKLLRPGDERFEEFTRPVNRRVASVRPAGVAVCANAEDVAFALKWSRENDIPQVPRSGGHSFMGYSTNQGLVISVGDMKSVRHEPESRRIIVDGGALNRDVSRTLRPANVMLPGGQCPSVGVAGLTLGGGLGFSMRSLGMVSDNLISTRVVLANGDIVTASETEHPDLFWALRGGGGGNFGINTEFTFKANPARECTHFSVDFAAASTAATLDAWFAMIATAPPELGITWYFEPATPQDEPYCGMWGLMYGSEADTRALLAPVIAAGGTPLDEHFVHDSFWEASEFLAEDDAAPHSYYDRSRFLEQRFNSDAIGALSDRLLNNPQSGFSTTIFAWGGVVGDIAPDATAFVHRQPTALIKYGALWKPEDAAAGDKLSGWVDETFEVMQPHCSRRSFQNFPDGKLEDPAVAYYGDNLRRLKEIKHKYDPDRLFNFPQAIPAP